MLRPSRFSERCTSRKTRGPFSSAAMATASDAICIPRGMNFGAAPPRPPPLAAAAARSVTRRSRKSPASDAAAAAPPPLSAPSRVHTLEASPEAAQRGATTAQDELELRWSVRASGSSAMAAKSSAGTPIK